MLEYLKSLINSVLLLVVPSSVIGPHENVPVATIHIQKSTQELLHAAPILTYDDVLNLIDDLEDGELEKRCNQADLEKINCFLANLAMQGLLPSETERDSALEEDIQELLYAEDNLYEYAFAVEGRDDYVVIPAIAYARGEVVLCKSWIKKKWEHTKKFVKKHKKSIIIGAAVVVAAAVVIGVVVASSAAAVAAGAATVRSDKDENGQSELKNESSDPSSSNLTQDPLTISSRVNEDPILKSVIEDHVTVFKDTLEDSGLLEMPIESKGHEDFALGEKARVLGSALAHETLNGISELTYLVPQLLDLIDDIGYRVLPEALLPPDGRSEVTLMENFENSITAGHEKVDEIFSTDQADYYTSESKEARTKFTVGMLPPPGMFTKISANSEKLAEAGKAIDRAGFTKVGRGLMKHGYRKDSVFPKPIGNPAQVNTQGQKVLESLLNHPERVSYERPHPDFGKVIDVVVPGKGGARFTAEGEMIGFLEPQGVK